MKNAVAQRPITAAIYADNLIFKTYSYGVINSKACFDEAGLNHHVLVAGYGKDRNYGEYWLI
jgi:hypothetical protein